MKNKILIIIVYFFFSQTLFAENLSIQAKKISIDKINNKSLFEEEVIVKTDYGSVIKSDYAEYDKKNSLLILKKNIIAFDAQGNKLETNYAEYNETTKILKSVGTSNIRTSENYFIKSENIILDSIKKTIKSDKSSLIKDVDDNEIYLENFEYNSKKNIFKSIGFIKLKDKLNNSYEFSQIYIDTEKKELLGTDIKSFLNDESFKFKKENKPRIFANTLKLNKNNSEFYKSIFTLCDYRKNDKCPPWSIQSTKMFHDSKKKTIYYENAVVKVYDFPIFYLPKLSHPDPTVKRRSGFLTPSFSDTKNLGAGLSVPYFWALNNDKNFTITNKLYASEHPLLIGEYHQALNNSSLLFDFGYTAGYKKTSPTKKKGEKSHFFSKFIKNFNNKNDSKSSLVLTTQDVSNDKYLKLYKIQSNLADYNNSTLENSLNYNHEYEDLFFNFKISSYETLKEDYNDKYEYILPEITLDKNLINNDIIGNLNLQTNFKIHNYNTNEYTNFFVNDFEWNYKDIYYNSGLRGKILGNIKNINYETRNIDIYKDSYTSELYGALGYLSELSLQKKNKFSTHLLTPKILLRYAPGQMRKDKDGFKLNPTNAFSIDRLNNINNFETGLTSTVGLDYEIKNKDEESFNFSVAQIINEKENKKMSSESSLDEKMSDLVGSLNYDKNENFNINYKFALDQNYSDINYNEIGTSMNTGPFEINIDFLQEKKHIGNQEYLKSKINYLKNDNGILSIEAKKNLVTNSSEYYNLSYEYINDCLRAGLVYRREFYTDSELEPENSLMFKITLTPFGNIDTPSFNQ